MQWGETKAPTPRAPPPLLRQDHGSVGSLGGGGGLDSINSRGRLRPWKGQGGGSKGRAAASDQKAGDGSLHASLRGATAPAAAHPSRSDSPRPSQ